MATFHEMLSWEKIPNTLEEPFIKHKDLDTHCYRSSYLPAVADLLGRHNGKSQTY